MKRAYIYKDERSSKFWWIDYSGLDFVVNYGKIGTTGKYKVKEFGSEKECTKEAEKLINSKIKKNYLEIDDFDYLNHLYFDDEEFGLYHKTSHPNFVKHFKDDFYYSCFEEWAPFGSDEGSDTLAIMSEEIRKNPKLNFSDFPRILIEDMWDMKYISVENLEKDEIDKLMEKDEMNLVQSDMVTYSAAFGQIKITGKLDPILKDNAIKAMKRFSHIILEKWDGDINITKKMIEDLDSFK